MSGLTPETGREISTLPALGSRRAPRFALISDLGGNSLRCNLTKTQEQKLIRAAKNGDETALETLVRCHIRYIAKIAGDYRRMGLHEEDLLGEGVLGFVEAVRRYQARYKTHFITYAYWWIRKNILSALSRESSLIHVPHDRLQKFFQVRKAENHLSNRLGRRPNLEELSEFLKTPIRELEGVITIMHYRTEWIEGTEMGGRNGKKVPAGLQVKGQDPLSLWLTRESRTRIRDVLGNLPGREKMVLSKRFGITGGKSLTLREIASTMGLSKERVRQIECRAKKRMRAILVGTNGKNA